ncbi:MAG: class E sortase, partial [Microthrixaceae bacterium]
ASAAASGVLAARVAPADEAPPPLQRTTAAAPDAAAMGAAGAALLDGLRVNLPVPQAPGPDPYAPTPEVRHGQLEIPSIGLSQPFFEGVTLTAINRGPSHWPGTAMPGHLGNVVIAGHRTTYSRPFWDLDLVKPGDELIFTLLSGERYVYALDRVEIVDAGAVEIVNQRYGYTATLFACHPKGSARQRIVGHFTLTSAPAGASLG